MSQQQTYTQILDTCDRKTDIEDLVKELLARIGDKWSMLIVENLAAGPLRFNELQRTIGRVSHKVLTDSLRALERDGFVSRNVFPEIPPRVEYELTALGESFVRPVLSLISWIQMNEVELVESRVHYDQERS